MTALRKVRDGTAVQADRDRLISAGITVIPTPGQMAAIEAAKQARERNQSLQNFRPNQVAAFEDFERDNEAHGLDVNRELHIRQYIHDHPNPTGNEYESTSAALGAADYGRVQYFSHFGRNT
jgi:hypothetical protein